MEKSFPESILIGVKVLSFIRAGLTGNSYFIYVEIPSEKGEQNENGGKVFPVKKN